MSSTDGITAPLTGLPASSAVAARSAVVVAIAGSSPADLSDADMVFEEVTSPLRYLAVFQSRQAAAAGPVTGTRPVDGPLLSVLRPLYAYDGGTASFIHVLDKTKITDVGYGADSSLYASSAAGVTVSTSAVRHSGHATSAPPSLLTYRGSQSGEKTLASTGQTRASAVTVSLPGYGTQRWSFESASDEWKLTSGGPAVSVANLIVQDVPYHTVYLSRRYDQTVPTAKVYGHGSFEAFTGTAASTATASGGGLAASGTWYKPGELKVTNYDDAQGYPMNFQPGSTWVVLAPAGTKISVTRPSS